MSVSKTSTHQPNHPSIHRGTHHKLSASVLTYAPRYLISYTSSLIQSRT